MCFDDSIANSNDNQALAQQIVELKRMLSEESQNYKRKLKHFEESQERQSQVVLKLQQKVLQYKAKCSEMEFHLDNKNTEVERYKTIKMVDRFFLLRYFFLFNFFSQSKNYENQNLHNEEERKRLSSFDIEELLMKIEEEQQK